MSGSKNRKILFISHVLDNSGAPRSLLQLLKCLTSENIEKVVLALRRDDLRDKYREFSDKVVVINPTPPTNILLKLIERILTIPFLIFFILRENPSLIFINSAANSRAILFSKLLGYKTWVFVREFDEEFVMLAGIRKKFIKLADRVFVTNKLHEKWIRDSVGYSGEIFIIPNGIDFSELDNLKSQQPPADFMNFISKYDFIVANIGYLQKRKGWDYFLEIIKNIGRRFDNIGFIIIGDFIYKEEKRAFITELKRFNLVEKIYITGITSNPFKYLKYASVVAITSRSENFPRVVLESMALSIPVISFDVGAVKYMMPPDYPFIVNGYNISKFCQYIVNIYNMNPSDMEKLRLTLSEHSKMYSLFNICEKFRNIIVEELLSNSDV